MARKKEEHRAGAPAWMMTYGDLVTQMLTFFILLFTFSTLDTVKFRDAVISLQGAFGVLSGGTQILNLSDMPTMVPVKMDANLQSKSFVQVKNLLDELIKEEMKKKQKESQDGNQDSTTTEMEKSEPLIMTVLDERGLRIRFTDPVLFALGKADLNTESIDILRDVSDILSGLPNKIVVEGHTDNIPIKSARFKSNLELSIARAGEVWHFLIEEGGIDPHNLSAAGYSEYHPLKPNDSAENRRINRRVEILILNEDLNSKQPVDG
ncbi:MAG: flagellar motor protein MotB [bacterium]